MRVEPHYQFALIDRTTAQLGVGLTKIIYTWEELEGWFQSRAAARQIAIGYVGYEGNVYFGIFQELKRVPLRQLINTTPFTLHNITGEPFRQYRNAILKLKAHLAVGDIYQANYCYTLTADTQTTPQQLLHYFSQHQPTPYSAMIDTPDIQLVSNSPELGVRINDTQVTMQPMKGTTPSGIRNKRKLQTSLKDKAELDMIIDVCRNDLAQFAKPGSIQVKQARQIVKYTTVWQAQANIQAQRPKSVTSLQVIKALLPFASVTGAPKQRATEILAELESAPRGIYCGGIGYIRGRNQAEFNVAIRTAVLQNGQLRYGVGSGVTFDSDPKAEYQETLDKAKLIFAKST